MSLRRALLIDLDGVLRTWDVERALAVERWAGLPDGAIAKTGLAKDLLEPVLTGKIDDPTWRRRLTSRLLSKHPEAQVADAVAAWSANVGTVNREVLGLVRRVRANHTVVLVANATTRLADDLEQLGLTDAFDHVVNSAQLGHCKPDAAVFEHALALAEVEAGSAVFVDDVESNVAGAAALGIPAIAFTDAAALGEALTSNGLLEAPAAVASP